MASVILTNNRCAIADVWTTSGYQPQTIYGPATVTRSNTSLSLNSKERLDQLHAACEMLSDLAERRQSLMSINIQPKAILTERLEYGKKTIGIASRQVETFSREQAIEELQTKWLGQERNIFETERKMRRLETDIIRLQMEEAIEGCEIANQTNDKWWDKVFSFALGATSRRAKDAMAKRELTKRERNRQRTESIEDKRKQMLIRSNELSILETEMKITERAIEELDEEIGGKWKPCKAISMFYVGNQIIEGQHPQGDGTKMST
ncbi:hypothetical protein FHL15_008011 [Xylaria flabelliformis]|uniref:Uncharacterized protein n=1 Tax=Xylaria flabelliformis TaxID=2512241 RepID=A0A553HSU4_9PEZI|nr:hypothetical protein FHL15_008011 [Xylaria flabelliformis]